MWRQSLQGALGAGGRRAGRLFRYTVGRGHALAHRPGSLPLSKKQPIRNTATRQLPGGGGCYKATKYALKYAGICTKHEGKYVENMRCFRNWPYLEGVGPLVSNRMIATLGVPETVCEGVGAGVGAAGWVAAMAPSQPCSVTTSRGHFFVLHGSNKSHMCPQWTHVLCQTENPCRPTPVHENLAVDDVSQLIRKLFSRAIYKQGQWETKWLRPLKFRIVLRTANPEHGLWWTSMFRVNVKCFLNPAKRALLWRHIRSTEKKICCTTTADV